MFPAFSAYVANPDRQVVYVDSRELDQWYTPWGDAHTDVSMRETLWDWASEGHDVAMIADQVTA